MPETLDDYVDETSPVRVVDAFETIEVLADRGYFKSEKIAACEEAGIEVYVPKPLTSNARAQGRFDRRDFVYDRERNAYGVDQSMSNK